MVDFRYIANHIRYAIVTDVNYDEGIMKTRWLDNAQSDDAQDVIIPHPAAGRGEGIFFGIRPGAIVALGMSPYERYVPVAIIPVKGFYNDIENLSESHFDDVGFPQLGEGEIIIQGITGGKISLNNSGNMLFKNAFDEGFTISGDSDRSDRCSIMQSSPVEYTISQSGLLVNGLIRRDLRSDEDELDISAADPLYDIQFEQILEEIGLDPSKQISLVTRSSPTESDAASITDQFRNPPFVERRNIFYEFGKEWQVGDQNFEESLLIDKKNQIPRRIPSDRRERRTNILSLSYAFPNELIESIEGTLVDFFGNLLDINRHILPPVTSKKEKKWFEAVLENIRHTVALHKEINSKKGWNYYPSGLYAFRHEPNKKVPSNSFNNARDRSRWSIDVDKEGLTKINIPASSETGTIPVLARYENSSTVEIDENGNAKKIGRKGDDTKAIFHSNSDKENNRTDVFLDQFGPGGIKIINNSGNQNKGNVIAKNRLVGEKTSWIEEGDKITEGLLPDFVQAGTAFHNITKTALKVLENGLNKNSISSVSESSTNIKKDNPAVHSEINKIIPNELTGTPELDAYGRPINAPYAGGRSLHINLDGSLETSIGANTVDRVSWIMDTAGGVVARLGRDRFGRSAIVHMDGYLAMEIGGFDFIGSSKNDTVDTRFVGGGKSRNEGLPKDANIFRAGKVVIRVRRANENGSGPDQDAADQLIIIDENGISIESSGRLNLTSAGDMTLQSKSRILLDSRQIQLYKDQARFVVKNGKLII